MSTAALKPVLPPLLSWAIHDYLQEGQRKQVSRGWLTSTRHVLRLLLLASNDIPVDAIGKPQIDAFWHAFRYWPSGASRRRDLIGCTDAQILTIGFIEAKPAPSDINYLLAQKTLRHFFAWLQQHGAVVRAPVELRAVLSQRVGGMHQNLSRKIEAFSGIRRSHRPAATSQTILPWKRPDASPLAGSTLSAGIEVFIRAERADGAGIAKLRHYAGTLRVLFAALDDIPLASVSDAHLARFWQLYHWWPQNRSPQKVDMHGLTDSQALEIGKQELAKSRRPSSIARAQEVISEFLNWAEREGAASPTLVAVRGGIPRPPSVIH